MARTDPNKKGAAGVSALIVEAKSRGPGKGAEFVLRLPPGGVGKHVDFVTETSVWAPFVESLYGYRYIKKTTTDRLGFAQTADWGLNATGKVGPNGLVGYSFSDPNVRSLWSKLRDLDVLPVAHFLELGISTDLDVAYFLGKRVRRIDLHAQERESPRELLAFLRALLERCGGAAPPPAS